MSLQNRFSTPIRELHSFTHLGPTIMPVHPSIRQDLWLFFPSSDLSKWVQHSLQGKSPWLILLNVGGWCFFISAKFRCSSQTKLFLSDPLLCYFLPILSRFIRSESMWDSPSCSQDMDQRIVAFLSIPPPPESNLNSELRRCLTNPDQLPSFPVHFLILLISLTHSFPSSFLCCSL